MLFVAFIPVFRRFFALVRRCRAVGVSCLYARFTWLVRGIVSMCLGGIGYVL